MASPITPEHLDLLTKLILGAYALAAGAFAWAWILYKWAVAYIKDSIHESIQRVDLLEQNHIHRLEERVDRLEQRVG